MFVLVNTGVSVIVGVSVEGSDVSVGMGVSVLVNTGVSVIVGV